MVGEFFIRFNLHNSVCNYPASFEVLKPLVDLDDEQLRAYLDKIDKTHAQRAERIEKELADKLNALVGKKVLFIGDSITSDNLGYRRTVTKVAKLNALDGAVSGGTSSTVLHSAKMQLQSFKPDMVSVMIGTNDSVSVDRENLHQVSMEEYERNVRAIAEWSLKSGAKVLLFEIPPIHEQRFAASFASQYKLQSNDTIKRYNRVLKNIANEYKIPLTSNSWIEDQSVDLMFEPDGIHFSIECHEIFSKKWLLSASKIINEKEQLR